MDKDTMDAALARFDSRISKAKKEDLIKKEADELRDKNIKRMAELGIIRSLPDSVRAPMKKGRLFNLYTKLIELVDIELNKLDKKLGSPTGFYKTYRSQIKRLYDEFGKLTRWVGGVEPVSVISFAAEFLEQSEVKYPKELYNHLREIVDYYERGGVAAEKDLWEGGEAFKVWKSLPAYVDMSTEETYEAFKDLNETRTLIKRARIENIPQINAQKFVRGLIHEINKNRKG